MAWVSVMGSAAGICTTVSFLPQVIKTWRTRSTADISLGMFLVLVLGLLLWLLYGLARGDWPLILANGTTLLFASIILIFKIRHG